MLSNTSSYTPSNNFERSLLPRSASLTNLSGQNSFDSAIGSFGSSTPKRQPIIGRFKASWKQEEEQKPLTLALKVSRSLPTDSGFNSPTSSPTHTMFTNGDGKAKTQADLKKTGCLDKLVEQPSTKLAGNIDVQQQAAQTVVKSR